MMSTANIVSRHIWLTFTATIFTLNTWCNSTTLQFSSSNDRPLALYRAPAPYQEAGKARLNSVIITSRPFSIGEQLNFTSRSHTTTTTTTTTTTPTPEPVWHRQFLVSSPRSSLSTTTPHPGEHNPHYSIDCSNGKSCSETFSVESTPIPTFKPYSKEVLEKFLNDYAAAKKHTINNKSYNVTPATVNIGNSTPKTSSEAKHNELSDVDNPAEATNRLANLYLDDEDDSDSISIDGKSRPQWSLVNAQQHNHPYDDREGWVTLEAVPWSSSKIAKWQSHSTGDKRPQWTTFNKPATNQYENRPITNDWNLEKPTKPYDRPQFIDRPQYFDRPGDFNNNRPSKPQFLIGNHQIDYPSPETTHRPVFNFEQRPVSDYDYKPSPGHQPQQQHQHWVSSSHSDIITDNTPENWPISVNRPGGPGTYKPWNPQADSDYNKFHNQQDDIYKYDTNRRPPTPVVYHDGQSHSHHPHPHNHPENSEGEWVLLSSTKGYSLPIRHHSYQRALTINPKPITSTKTVKLTVFPAVNGSTNTTTSHGGMLEVESNFQSVDDAQKYDEIKKAGQSDSVKSPVRLVSRPVRQGGSGRAVLAAVGAGMLPATMALLVPMMLGRKKRSLLIPKQNTTVAYHDEVKINVNYKTPSYRKEGEKRWNMTKHAIRRKKVVNKI